RPIGLSAMSESPMGRPLGLSAMSETPLDAPSKTVCGIDQVQARPDNDDINLKFLSALPSFRGHKVALAYGVKAVGGGGGGCLTPTHSAFIRAASSGSKLNYSNQQSIVPSVSQTSGRSDSIMGMCFAFFVAENEQSQGYDYVDFELGSCNVKTVDDKARYSAFKVTEVKTDEPKALVSVDSMVNWSDHTAENKTGVAEGLSRLGDACSSSSITGTYMPTHYKCDSPSESENYDPVIQAQDQDQRLPTAVDITTLPESDVEDPNSTAGSPSFSCLENVKSPRIFCNKSGMNNRNVCKNNSVRVKKCFVCGSKLHLIKDCDFYNCVESVPCKSKAASVPAGSRNSPASVTAGGSDPAASRNKPAVNSAGRPNPAGWSKRPAPVSAGRQVSAGWPNPAARPYFRPSSVYFNNMYWPNLYDPMYKGRWGSSQNWLGSLKCTNVVVETTEKLEDFMAGQEALSNLEGGDGKIYQEKAP
ncbi:hypothetical protein Tco_0739674, partial [Tanacetum coccineum]